MRESGMLFPIFSLPSKFGIGSFSREAFEFVDFLEKSGQGFWQILPVGPTGYGNSPYQPFSAFAGNPYFISPETLIEEGLLTWEEANEANFGSDPERVDYGALYENRFTLLKKAYDRFRERMDAAEHAGAKTGELSPQKDGAEPDEQPFSPEQASDGKNDPDTPETYKEFLQKEAYWLKDYALFTALKTAEGGKSWLDWEDKYRKRERSALEAAQVFYAKEIDFVCFQQYEFDRQWKKLRKYANARNVKIIGDLPFYVALDSADVWAHPEVFRMDEELMPKEVAGCPPDAFSRTGQLWGNPIYDWKALKEKDYDWWVKRIRRNYEFYDVIRIDHFHGFAEYYAVPYGAKTAENGTHEKGPGMDLFETLQKKLGKIRIIAEDLGTNTPENEKLLKDSGFPGMKVLQYGFTSWDSCYVNHRHCNNCVVYTGTHDNTPTMAWLHEIQDGERDFTRRYINSIGTDDGRFVWDFIREAYRSVADLCIIPLQDYLCKGREARINCPGTEEGNWQWRLLPNFLSDDLSRSIRELTEVYSRIPRTEEEPEKLPQ